MNRIRILRIIAAVLGAAALIAYFLSVMEGNGPSDESSAAAQLSRKVEKRMAILDRYIGEALDLPPESWADLADIPSDLVVYRYVKDTLQSWANQFPLRNDDIQPRTLVQRMGDGRNAITSPLADASAQPAFVNFGPKWYLVKAVEGNGMKVIGGLEIVNELRAGSLSGINRNFSVSERYTVRPLSYGTGTPVCVDGIPMFLLADETLAEPSSGSGSGLLWLAVFLFLGASLFLLSSAPTLPGLLAVLLAQGGILFWFFVQGRHQYLSSQIFSPLLYADGPFLYSLGAVIIVNLAINVLVLDIFLVRWTLLKRIRRKNSRFLESVLALVLGILVIGIVVHLHFSFRSIVINSSIVLNLYRVTLLNRFTALVYLSYLALSITLPVLLQMLSPLVRTLLGIRYDFFSPAWRIVYACAVGAYFVTASSTLGMDKEENRIDVWANRLAMDRDMSLEIQLRSVESGIANDAVISALSTVEGSAEIIRSRITTAYMGRISQDYDIEVDIPGQDIASAGIFQDRIRRGVRLGDNSHFFYSPKGAGRSLYTGSFFYSNEGFGVSVIFVTVESKHNREDRGYLSMLGISDPGRVSLPPIYSWAKYGSDKLFQYKGSYAYPTVYSGRLRQLAEQRTGGHVDFEGWCHFIREVSDDEVVVISRRSTEVLYYLVEGFMLAILAYFFITILSWKRRSSRARRYFQTRISLVIYVSLLVTLVAMAVFSVWFVYKRNNSDMTSIMTSRINTIQGMLQERLRQVEDPVMLFSQEVGREVDGVGNNLRCDITLFDPSGRVVMSTTPEVYDRMILGFRLDDNAYYNITRAHKRYFMQKEKVARRSYYALYAPVFNSAGVMVAIASSPFTELTQDFESEVILHVAAVVTIFFLLLLLARYVTSAMVSRIFRPLTALSRRMAVTDVDHLEPLVYDGEDEITPLVDAYNRMVQDLGDSSRRLAQAERDKAWTDMARRVAHDLKNPLTPIKLQLQMLIRMKQSGNPAWVDRFDEVASTVLYHVDLLADSADQFSTFAKMYDQKAEKIDLNSLVRQEVDLFDSREDVAIEYFGLEGAFVNAPRPQLTRVVVNLITNAIQAVESLPEPRKILLSLRNASEDGFYEIVVEDNGPGVPGENQERIFTPDFTTKTSGSGLGLAICKRIVEHCGGSISYSKSFTLGGACFTVKFPKC